MRPWSAKAGNTIQSPSSKTVEREGDRTARARKGDAEARDEEGEPEAHELRRLNHARDHKDCQETRAERVRGEPGRLAIDRGGQPEGVLRGEIAVKGVAEHGERHEPRAGGGGDDHELVVLQDLSERPAGEGKDRRTRGGSSTCGAAERE